MCVIHSMIFTICFVHAYITMCMYGRCTWSFMQIGKCVYLTKKLEFVTIRTQVSGLWSQGEEVQCGAVVNDTRVWQNAHTVTQIHVLNSVILHTYVYVHCTWMITDAFFFFWFRLCFVLHLVRCFFSFKSAQRCGNLTHQVSTWTSM